MHELKTARFGTVVYQAADLIHCGGGLPGFRNLRDFLLIENAEFEPIRFLQSVDNPLISFPLIDPRLVVPDYRVTLSPEQQEELGLTDAQECLTYSILTLGDQPENASANLFAPLVINTSKMQAAQVILMHSDYSVAEPLLRQG